MVAMVEIAFLIVCVGLGVWCFRRTSMYRNYRNREAGRGPDPGTRESMAKMPLKNGITPPG